MTRKKRRLREWTRALPLLVLGLLLSAAGTVGLGYAAGLIMGNAADRPTGRDNAKKIAEASLNGLPRDVNSSDLMCDDHGSGGVSSEAPCPADLPSRPLAHSMSRTPDARWVPGDLLASGMFGGIWNWGDDQTGAGGRWIGRGGLATDGDAGEDAPGGSTEDPAGDGADDPEGDEHSGDEDHYFPLTDELPDPGDAGLPDTSDTDVGYYAGGGEGGLGGDPPAGGTITDSPGGTLPGGLGGGTGSGVDSGDDDLVIIPWIIGGTVILIDLLSDDGGSHDDPTFGGGGSGGPGPGDPDPDDGDPPGGGDDGGGGGGVGAAIPEPTTLVGLLYGLGVLGGYVCRRSKLA